MISFDTQNHRFNLRAAAVFLQDTSVLLHRLDGDTIWALPGGRVEPGEDAASAVVREMAEELGETVECDRLLYVVENFFEHRSQPNHEVGLYFLARFAPHSPVLSMAGSHFGVEGGSRLEFRWFPLSSLSTVNLLPSCLRASLAQAGLPFKHVVHRG